MALDVIEAGQWALDNAADFPLPLLLMHGDADRLTSCGASRLFAQRMGERCMLKIWGGLFHEMHNEPEAEQVMSEMVAWMDEIVESN
jgi:alpha-beta hydrolase superfamily lysophospholipase